MRSNPRKRSGRLAILVRTKLCNTNTFSDQSNLHCSLTVKADPHVCEHGRSPTVSTTSHFNSHLHSPWRYIHFPTRKHMNVTNESSFAKQPDRLSPPTSSGQGLRRQRASKVLLNTRTSFGAQSEDGMSRQHPHQGDLVSGSGAECGEKPEPKIVLATTRPNRSLVLFTSSSPPHIKHTTQLLRQSAVVPCCQSLPSDESTVPLEARRITSVMQSVTATGATRWQPRENGTTAFCCTQTDDGKSTFLLQVPPQEPDPPQLESITSRCISPCGNPLLSWSPFSAAQACTHQQQCVCNSSA